MKPYFSIIIPLALNRDCEVLNSIKQLDFPKNQYEVIIERGTNPSRNRNIGAKKAKGEILCILDDDAIVPKGLLKKAKEYFCDSKYNIAVLGGPQLTPPDDGWFAKACGEVLASKFGSLSMSKRYRQEKADYNADENSLTSCIMFVRAKAFKDIGGFNEKLFPGEDPEFLARAKQKGYRIAYSPDIYIYHRRRATPLAFAEQMFSYGKVRLDKEKSAKSEGKKGLMFYIPMLFALYVIISLFFNIAFLNTSILRLDLNILLTMYFLAAFFASLKIFFENKDFTFFIYPFILPFIFFMTHFFYGLGMIEGWLGRWFKD